MSKDEKTQKWNISAKLHNEAIILFVHKPLFLILRRKTVKPNSITRPILIRSLHNQALLIWKKKKRFDKLKKVVSVQKL